MGQFGAKAFNKIAWHAGWLVLLVFCQVKKRLQNKVSDMDFKSENGIHAVFSCDFKAMMKDMKQKLKSKRGCFLASFFFINQNAQLRVLHGRNMRSKWRIVGRSSTNTVP